MWQREVLEHSVSLQAVLERHMPKTLLYNKTIQSKQTFGSLILPYLPVTTMWTVWLYPCHPSNNNYFMPWTLTSLSPAIIWQVRKREHKENRGREKCLWLGGNPISNVTVSIRCQPMHLNQSACQSSCQSAWMSEKQMERLQWLVQTLDWWNTVSG